MKIDIFTPPKFDKSNLNIEYLNHITRKNWIYGSNGRTSIYHILKLLGVDKVLIPVYICPTALFPLKQLDITPIFYDIDVKDLNPSLKSIKKLSQMHDVKAVLVASMYGNPANLVEIEQYCENNNIFMIDDAAQSFGAKLNDKYIGTFGDAGFFSFSPGKPTAGHMGSFFWSKEKIRIQRTNHCFTHYLKWLDFYINRYKSYSNYNVVYKKSINFVSRVLLKFIDIKNDFICTFEEQILGGILADNLNGKFDFRATFVKQFIKKFEKSKKFRVLKNIRGIANNHKFVIIFFDGNQAQSFICFMEKNGVYSSNGYRLLSDDLDMLPNAKTIDRCVVELPIEKDEEKMKYIFNKVEEFENS